MPDGEVFKGRAVMQGRRTTIGYQDFSGMAFGPGGTVRANVFGPSSSNTYTGQMGAVLLGNRGRSMRCQFQYASTAGFTGAGGAGVCQVSDGKDIDIVW
jgi:hypothetical protein